MAEANNDKSKSYPVLEGLRHNGKVYKPGDAVDAADITAKEAKALADAGVLGKAVAGKPSGETA